jgi:hypothetical protein
LPTGVATYGPNHTPGTISSDLRCGENLVAWLTANGLPTAVASVTREHIEAFLADMLDRLDRQLIAADELLGALDPADTPNRLVT